MLVLDWLGAHWWEVCMESSYTAPFAQAYNQRWTGFVTLVGPRLRALYEQVCPRGERSLLDVCCGTGQLALQFLQAGCLLSRVMLPTSRCPRGLGLRCRRSMPSTTCPASTPCFPVSPVCTNV